MLVVKAGSRQERPPGRAGYVDDGQLGVGFTAALPPPPARRDGAAIRRDTEGLLVQGAPGGGREVTRFGRPGEPVEPRDSVLARGGRVHGEQAELGRAQVVIPVPHRDRLVQDGRDTGFLPRLAQPRVVSVPTGTVPTGTGRISAVRSGTRPGHHRTGDDDRAGPFGSFQRVHTARPVRPADGFTAGGRQQPQAGPAARLTAWLAPPAVRPRRAVRVAGLLTRPLGDEQQRPVGQEPRVVFAVW